MSLSPCSHCPKLSHQDGPHTSSWLGLWPLGRVLGHSRARLLLLLDPLEGGNSGPSQTPAPLGPQDSGNPFHCSKPEPGAGDVRELILVPTGDSSWAEPSPALQETTPQPSPAPTLGGWGVSPQSRLQPSRHHTCALILRPDPPRPLLPGPTATPAGTGVTDAQPLQLTLTRNKRAPQSPGPGSEGRGGGGVRGSRVRRTELRLPGGKRDATDLPKGTGEAPQALQRRGSWGAYQQAWAGGSGEKEALVPPPILPLVTVGAQAQVTRPQAPPERETPRCTQLGLSPALVGGWHPTSPGPAQLGFPTATPKGTLP